jgi:hypothetical protein
MAFCRASHCLRQANLQCELSHIEEEFSLPISEPALYTVHKLLDRLEGCSAIRVRETGLLGPTRCWLHDSQRVRVRR